MRMDLRAAAGDSARRSGLATSSPAVVGRRPQRRATDGGEICRGAGPPSSRCASPPTGSPRAAGSGAVGSRVRGRGRAVRSATRARSIGVGRRQRLASRRRRRVGATAAARAAARCRACSSARARGRTDGSSPCADARATVARRISHARPPSSATCCFMARTPSCSCSSIVVDARVFGGQRIFTRERHVETGATSTSVFAAARRRRVDGQRSRCRRPRYRRGRSRGRRGHPVAGDDGVVTLMRRGHNVGRSTAADSAEAPTLREHSAKFGSRKLGLPSYFSIPSAQLSL